MLLAGIGAMCEGLKPHLILNPLSIGYISGKARGKRQEAKGGINNQFLITRFSII
jgi:hypothetical protein